MRLLLAIIALAVLVLAASHAHAREGRPRPHVVKTGERRLRPPYAEVQEATNIRDARGDDRKTVRVTLLMTESRNKSWDGGPPRTLIQINGQAPGPTITVNVGDTLVATVINQLTEPAAMHWHGIKQIDSFPSDGVPQLTQRLILPLGGQFVYTFKCDSPGTYWYHSHYLTQYTDGMRGTLVVLDPKQGESHKRRNNVVFFHDFWYLPALPLTLAYLAPSTCGPEGIDLSTMAAISNPAVATCNTDGVEPTPQSALLNSVGQCNPARSREFGLPCDTKKVRYARVTAESSKPCLCSEGFEACRKKQGVLRLVNAGTFALFTVSIDEHKFWLVRADSVELVPTEEPVGEVRVNVAQRYDITICRDNSRKSPVWIRALMEDSIFFAPAINNLTRGILQYQPEKDHHDSSKPPASKRWKPSEIVSVADPAQVFGEPFQSTLDPYRLEALNLPPPPPPTRIICFSIFLDSDPGFVEARFQSVYTDKPEDLLVNLPPYSTGPPPEAGGKPLLECIQIWNAMTPATRESEEGRTLYIAIQKYYYLFNVIDVEKGDVVDLVFNNDDPGQHPLHTHGYDFWIVSRGPDKLDCSQPNITDQYVTGFGNTARDTATIEPDGHLVLRIAYDRVGIWSFHCHIDFHLAAGLGISLKVGMLPNRDQALIDELFPPAQAPLAPLTPALP